MKISQRGIDLIKEFEGFSATPYECPGGIFTIGYGHTHGVSADSPPITKKEAETLLRDDVCRAENAVLQMIDVPLNENQFAALVSLVFNIGAAAFAGSTLRRFLNAADYAGAAVQFDRWVHAKGVKLAGLTRRRAAERALFEEEI
jgi:lysozyme